MQLAAGHSTSKLVACSESQALLVSVTASPTQTTQLVDGHPVWLVGSELDVPQCGLNSVEGQTIAPMLIGFSFLFGSSSTPGHHNAILSRL